MNLLQLLAWPQFSREDAWYCIAYIGLVELLLGVLATYQHYRRKVTGKGPSPLPPLFGVVYAVPTFGAKKLLFASGLSVYRILESLIVLLICFGYSVMICGVLPAKLSDWLAKKKVR